jgi:hypothetical protein
MQGCILSNSDNTHSQVFHFLSSLLTQCSTTFEKEISFKETPWYEMRPLL